MALKTGERAAKMHLCARNSISSVFSVSMYWREILAGLVVVVVVAGLLQLKHVIRLSMISGVG